MLALSLLVLSSLSLMNQLQAWTVDRHKKLWPPVGLIYLEHLITPFSVKRLAQETNMVCIATIHQLNWEVFSLFDHLTLLVGGQVMYNGPASMSVFLNHLAFF